MNKKAYVVGSIYRISRQIGSGSFGRVHKGHIIGTKTKIAAKFEACDSLSPQLQNESQILTFLGNNPHIPKVYWYGRHEKENVMIIPKYDRSLREMMSGQGQFSLKTSVMIVMQMIDTLEFIHSKGVIHRDIKPNNILVNKKLIVLIDFGLSKRYTISGIHIPYKEEKHFVGTYKYSSVNTHLGIEQSRRDDIEALGYLLIYFLKGRLPWSDMPNYRIFNYKQNKIEKACEDLPEQVHRLIEYARSLSFHNQPDYRYLRNLLRNLLSDHCLKIDNVFDWRRRKSRKRKTCNVLDLSDTIEDKNFPIFKDRERIMYIKKFTS